MTAFPRVEGEEIRFYFASGMEDLAPGAMGILEPLPGRCQLALVTDAPVVTPGLAFSLKGDRVGYGKGYYDRFFLREPRHRRIGVAYPFQIRDDLEPEVQDQKIDRKSTRFPYTTLFRSHIAREGYDRAKGCEKETLFMGLDTSSAKSPARTCRVFFGVCYVNAF